MQIPSATHPTASVDLSSLEYAARKRAAEAQDKFRRVTDNLQSLLAANRTECGIAIYGAGLDQAQRVFEGLGPAAPQVVAEDILARILLEVRAPGSGSSPLPTGINIVARDSGGESVPLDAVAAGIMAALMPVLTATSVEIVALPPA